jgi:hypothetical protein
MEQYSRRWLEIFDFRRLRSDPSVHLGDSFRRRRGSLRSPVSQISPKDVPMKIRFAVLAAMVLASVIACTQSPTASDRRSPSTISRDGTSTTDTTNRTGGIAGTGH